MVVSILIPAVTIALIVILIVGIKSEPGKGGEEMIKNVYIYLVLFATLMMTIGGSVAAFMAIADIVSPASYYQSFDDYSRWGNEKPYVEGDTSEIKLTEEQLRVKYDAMVQEEKLRQVQQGKNNLIKSLGWIFIPLIVFIYFSRRIPKSEKSIK